MLANAESDLRKGFTEFQRKTTDRRQLLTRSKNHRSGCWQT